MTNPHTLNLTDLIVREPIRPWVDGENIPWDDPDFSRRMLAEHLAQEHDAASRRSAKVAEQVDWIHRGVLGEARSRVLDLTCGPGLYTSALAARGHECRGIDFSPASVEYAREQAARDGLACSYDLGDVREVPFETGVGLAMMLFGQFNVFRREDARAILQRAADALEPGGTLLLEPQRFETIAAAKDTPATWYTAASGLFSDRPHLCLVEHGWDADARTSTTRFHVVDAATAEVACYALSNEAYTEAEYLELAEAAGLVDARIEPSLTGEPDPSQAAMCVLVARKPPLG